MGRTNFTIKSQSFLLWGLITSLAWILVLITRPIGGWIGTGYVICLLVYCLVLFFKGNLLHSLSILVYLAVIEPIIRTYSSFLPYLGLEYFFLGWIAAFALMTRKKSSTKWMPFIFYSLFLLLELFGLLRAENLEYARGILILSLTIGAALYFAVHIKITSGGSQKLFSFLIVGCINILSVIGYGYITNQEIQWETESSFAASGGMGPVQISMLLALGIIAIVLLLEKVKISTRILFLIIITISFIGMILTFSRNGIYLIGIACFCYFIVFSKLSFRKIFTLGIVLLVALIAFNIGTDYAGEVLIERYSDTNPSNRDVLVKYGWEIFLDNPFTGVGTSNFYSEISSDKYFGRTSGSHNELIRAAAEHGIFGLVFWVLFFVSSVLVVMDKKKRGSRALRMTLLAVFFAYLAVNGVKLLIQPLLLLIALAFEDFGTNTSINEKKHRATNFRAREMLSASITQISWDE